MRRWLCFVGRLMPLLACLALLAGCLQRVNAPAGTPNTPAVATVPPGFFVATPFARTPTPVTASLRFALGKVETLAADDPRARYAAPLRQRDTAFVQVALHISGLAEPHTPEVAYELVTERGVFAALASGEWDVAQASGAIYEQDGVLLFVVPDDLRTGRLEIAEYAYVSPLTGGADELQRRVLASFDLTRLR